METTHPPNYETRAPNVIALAVVMIVVSTLAVVLRFWSRAVEATMVFWWDDWAMLATLIFSHVFLAMNIQWTTIGLGKHSWMIPKDQVAPNAITSRATLVIYAVVIMMIKISALLLYKRLFKVNYRFSVLLWVIGAITTAWCIITIIVPWFSCTPIQKDVNPFHPGICKEVTPWYLASAFINAFMDFVVLLLPMPMIWRLQMSFYRKVLISLVLLLGYCSAFLSFARFIIIVKDPNILSASPLADLSWDLVPVLYLSMMEGPFAIMALCGPAINQLVARILKYKSLSSLFTSRPHDVPGAIESEGSSGSRNRQTNSGFSKIEYSSNGTAKTSVWETGKTSSTTAIAKGVDVEIHELQEPYIPVDSIRSKSDIDVPC